MDQRLHSGPWSLLMNLKCVFHVSSTSIRTAEPSPSGPSAVRPRMASALDLEVEWVDQPAPRGTAHETWQRARGWSSED